MISDRDAEGFTVQDAIDGAFEAGAAVPSAAPTIPVPRFYADCATIDEARIKAIKMLMEPYSSQINGIDEMYLRFSRVLILLLGAHGGFEP